MRIWDFRRLFYFAIDEEKGAFIIRQIVTLTHFPTVGHPSSIGFRLGPALYYLLAPFYAVFSSSPFVWGWVSVGASIISMWLIYVIGKRKSMRAGLFAAFFYAVSYLTVLYDRRGWQVSFHSLIALSTLHILLKLKECTDHKKPTGRWVILLTAVLILAVQAEVATILFLPVAVFSLWYFRISVSRRILFVALVIFLLSHAGLLIFDIRHDFLNTKYLLNYFNSGATTRIARNIPLEGIRTVYRTHNLLPATFARLLFPFSEANAAVQYANCPQYLLYKHGQVPILAKLFIVTVFALLFFSAFWKKQDKNTAPLVKIMAWYFLLLIGGSSLYTYVFHGEMAEYYFLGGFAYFLLFLGILADDIAKTPMRWLLGFGMLLFTVDNTSHLFATYNPYGYTHKEDAVRYAITAAKGAPFTLDSYQTCWYSGGYRYLFTLLGHEPVRSYMDQYMNEYYETDTKTKPEFRVTLLTPELIGEQPNEYERIRQETQKRASESATFGAIEVYVEKL